MKPHHFLFPLKVLLPSAILVLSSLSPLAAPDPPHDTSTGTGCFSCHDVTSINPMLLPDHPHGGPLTIDDTLINNNCWGCHVDADPPPYVETHSSLLTSSKHGYLWSIDCSVCHNQHTQEQNNLYSTTYGKFIRSKVDLGRIKLYDLSENPITDPAKTGFRSVKLTAAQGPNSFADGDATIDGICEVCHTQTRHFRNDGTALDQLHSTDHNGKPAKVGSGNDCTMCHKHENGFAANMPTHSATPGSDWVVVFEEGTHDDVMVGDGAVYAECKLCHNTGLSEAHDYQCLACHPSPAETVIGSWGGGCQQGGCHTTIHADVSAAHNAVDDDCSKCHGPDRWPTSAECAKCHAFYNPADTTPPVTTSNAKGSYIGPARIEYSVRDGGKVVVAQSYSRVDGGAELMGSSILITEADSHTLEFWSVDQANNIESPPNVVNFVIAQDTTPPVTTSNAQASYYSYANISLSSSDDSDLGVKATYYSLDGGPTKEGSSVYVPGSPGTFVHTLDFWSEDWSGNVENNNTASFSISAGTGTFRMWGGGSSCTNDPGADAFWIIKRDNYNGSVLAEGTDGCDVVFPVGATAYFIMVEWWNPDGYWDEYVYGTYFLTNHGDIIVLD